MASGYPFRVLLAFAERLDSPFGPISFHFDIRGRLVEIKLRSIRETSQKERLAGIPSRDALENWLGDFFMGIGEPFPGFWVIPDEPPFFARVWQEVAKIPIGKTLSYSEVASRIGSPKASRAVGNAMAQNPLPFIVPCHRVRAASGLGGFGGGVLMKKALLVAEGASYS